MTAVHTGARNDMTLWSEIACQRGCDGHSHRWVDVTVGEHGYGDLPAVPRRLERSFRMAIWDVARTPVDGGPYCPARDAVSETILSHRIWEPAETILTLAVCASAAPGSLMVDVGAQLGWFSLLALSCGLDVLAFDAETENLRLLQMSADANGWTGRVAQSQERLSPDSAAMQADLYPPIRLAKIDVEGAEDEAVRVLWPAIEAGRVDHLLVEVSPVFADYYPALVQRIIDVGYRVYQMPGKSRPPALLDDLPAGLGPDLATLDRDALAEMVASCHQINLWFAREGASW